MGEEPNTGAGAVGEIIGTFGTALLGGAGLGKLGIGVFSKGFESMSLARQMITAAAESGGLGAIYGAATDGTLEGSVEQSMWWGMAGALPFWRLFPKTPGVEGISKSTRDFAEIDVTKIPKTPEEAQAVWSKMLKEGGVEVVETPTKRPDFTPDGFHQTKLEKSMSELGELGREYKLHKTELESKTKFELDTIRWAGRDANEVLREGRVASEETIERFFTKELEGKVTSEELEAVQDLVFRRELMGLADEDTVTKLARKLESEGQLVRDPQDFKTPRPRTTLQTKTLDLIDKLDDIEKATTIGLKPYASKSSIDARLEELIKKREKIKGDYYRDEKGTSLIEKAISKIDDITEERPLGVSTGYLLSPNFERFREALDVFYESQGFLLRSGEMEKMASHLSENITKFRKRLIDSVKKSETYDVMSLTQAEDLSRAIVGGKKIDPKNYNNMRITYAKYIREELDKLLPDDINPDTAKQIREIKARGAKLSEEYTNPQELKAARDTLGEELRGLKRQLAESYLSNPNIARAIAEERGNERLAYVIDLYAASLGDEVARARVSFGTVNHPWAVKNAVTQNRALLTPETPKVSDIGEPRRPNFINPAGDVPSAPVPFEEAAQNLSFGGSLSSLAKLALTFTTNARHGARTNKSPLMRAALTKVADWGDELGRRYNAVQNDYDAFRDEMLGAWKQYNTTLGANESMASRLPDDISKLANTLIDDELAKGVSREAAYETVDNIIRTKIAQQSPEIRESYRRFEEITEWIRDKHNSAANIINKRIDEGSLEGEKVGLIPKRPGWTYFTYEGDFWLKHIRPDGTTFTIAPAFSREEAVSILKKYYKSLGDDVRGQIVSVPKLFDDASQVLKLPDMDLNKAFGTDAVELGTLIKTGKFKPNILHDVFYGSRKKRSLNLDEYKLNMEQALTINAMAAIRVRHYSEMMLEGRMLQKELKGLNETDWVKHVQSMGDGVLGLDTSLTQTIDDHLQGTIRYVFEQHPESVALASKFGLTPQSRVVRSASHFLSAWGLVAGLGWNLGAAIANPTLLGVTGGVMWGFDNMSYAIRNFRKLISTPEAQRIFKDNRINLRHPKSLFADIYTHNAPKSLQNAPNRVMRAIEDLFMYPFAGTETYTRAAMALGTMRYAEKTIKALKKGITTGTWQENLLKDSARVSGKPLDHPRTLDIFVNRALKKSAFEYSPVEMSELARNPITKPMMQFKTFPIKMFEVLAGRTAPLTHKERFMMLGIITTIGGLFSLPGVSLIDKLSTDWFGVSPKLWMMSAMPDIVNFGFPSAAGINMQTHMDLDVGGLFDLDPRGVGLSSAARAVSDYRQGGDISAAVASVSKPTRILHNAITLMKYGYITDSKGRVSMTADELGAGGTAATMLGFNRTAMAKLNQAQYVSNKEIERSRHNKKQALEEILRAKAKGDGSRVNELKQRYELTNKDIERYRTNRAKGKLDRIRPRLRQIEEEAGTINEVLEDIEY